jgi:hypothetical protein
MRCARCNGLIVYTHFTSDHTWEYDGWQCLNCGNIDDPLIASNRETQANGSIGPMSAKGMRGAGGTVAVARYQRLERLTHAMTSQLRNGRTLDTSDTK